VAFLLALLPCFLFGTQQLIMGAWPARPRRQNVAVLAGAGVVSVVAAPLTGGAWSLHATFWGVLSGVLWATALVFTLRAFQSWGVSRTMPLNASGQIIINALAGIILLGEWRAPGAMPLGRDGSRGDHRWRCLVLVAGEGRWVRAHPGPAPRGADLLDHLFRALRHLPLHAAPGGRLLLRRRWPHGNRAAAGGRGVHRHPAARGAACRRGLHPQRHRWRSVGRWQRHLAAVDLDGRCGHLTRAVSARLRHLLGGRHHPAWGRPGPGGRPSPPRLASPLPWSASSCSPWPPHARCRVRLS